MNYVVFMGQGWEQYLLSNVIFGTGVVITLNFQKVMYETMCECM